MCLGSLSALLQHNRLKEYKHREARLRQELKEEKDQAAVQRIRYTDWNKELQDRITALRAEKKTWTSEAAVMRAAEKEAKVSIWVLITIAILAFSLPRAQDTFEAQRKLLAEANHTVFRLQTQIKENAHKVDRLYDYETQIDQLMRLQRLWYVRITCLIRSRYLTTFQGVGCTEAEQQQRIPGCFR